VCPVVILHILQVLICSIPLIMHVYNWRLCLPSLYFFSFERWYFASIYLYFLSTRPNTNTFRLVINIDLHTPLRPRWDISLKRFSPSQPCILPGVVPRPKICSISVSSATTVLHQVNSAITVLHQVTFDRPLFLCPGSVHLRGIFGLFILGSFLGRTQVIRVFVAVSPSPYSGILSFGKGQIFRRHPLWKASILAMSVLTTRPTLIAIQQD